MDTKAFIAGCSGLTLTEEEKTFFANERPWGFILFARNIESPDQVRALCAELRLSVDDPTAPILIDQEGGRVQRLRPPHWQNYPAAARLGTIYDQDREAAYRAVWLLSRIHAFDLQPLGINVDCLPVLDLPAEGMHEVIGDRAYGPTVEHIVALGKAACDGLKSGGVLPVIKHIPGHGRGTSDSHLELPRVSTRHEELAKSDFLPFAALRQEPMAMTAHIVFEAIDDQRPATTSGKMINDIIRGEIGFDGLLMSDDVSMRALSGDFADRTRAIFDAGCDIVLHCNGEMEEMKAVASATPQLSGKATERASSALTATAGPDGLDEQSIRDEFEETLARFLVS